MLLNRFVSRLRTCRNKTIDHFYEFVNKKGTQRKIALSEENGEGEGSVPFFNLNIGEERKVL
jgi:hypothetical protein